MKKLIFLLLLLLVTCGPAQEPQIPTRYFSYECAWCGFYEGSDAKLGCYLQDGSYHSQDELLADPSHWYHFACCDSWWGGLYMCGNSGLCNDCLDYTADVPPQTALGCSSSPWSETWNVFCDIWNKKCYNGSCK